MYRSQKPISPAGNGLNKARILSAVAQGVPESADGCVEAVVEVDKGVCGPQPALQLFPGNYLSRSFQQQGKDLEGLFLQFDPGAAAS